MSNKDDEDYNKFLNAAVATVGNIVIFLVQCFLVLAALGACARMLS